MPQGIGTYGSKLGRPPKNARESAIRRGGQKGTYSKIKGRLMTGKASPHTIGKFSRMEEGWRKLAKSTKTQSEKLKLARSKMKIAVERAKAKKKKG